MPRGEFDRSARKAQTRARLLEAAARVYARRGFSGATLDEVAAEAGFTKGAVYGHFGSKENLLLALMDEHLARQIAEQVALFDRGRITWERPLAGSASWMQGIEQDPDPLRLFVELWTYAQRDERLRGHLQAGLELSRATFARFAVASAADAGAELGQDAAEQFGNIVIGLGMGLAMLKLIDPQQVPGSLLGTVLSMLIRTAEADPQVRELLAHPERSLAPEVASVS
ncbi:MAG TPA: TetR/AcrR family transcriptional regulator [Solirubrobacteraceae bacterium]|jgi:AcrR family transcriptional regulator|nr:TetR/AcrR family transcriptional regulator [Solirubrobacteraceae bacterium]